MTELIGLSQVPREIQDVTVDGSTTPYRQLYNSVLDGDVPAEHVRGRWYIRRNNLKRVAIALGLAVSDR